jgi:hypothetical protein
LGEGEGRSVEDAVREERRHECRRGRLKARATSAASSALAARRAMGTPSRARFG